MTARKSWLGSTLTVSILVLGALVVQSATPPAETPQQRYDRLLAMQRREPPPPLGQGSGVTGVTAQDVLFQSAALDRKMRYRVLLPAGYSSSHRYYPILYLLHGYMNPYYEWDKQTSLARHLEAGHHDLIVVLPQFDNSFYIDSVKPGDAYETYFWDDLLPHVEAHFRVRTEPPARAIAGVSMGGYGALLYALRKPWKFAFAGSFGGPVDIMKSGADYSRVFLPWVLEDVIGQPGSETRTKNDVPDLVRNADPKGPMPYLWLSCGNGDGWLSFNFRFAELLTEKKIPYELHTGPGDHEWKYWDAELPAMLQAIDRKMAVGAR